VNNPLDKGNLLEKSLYLFIAISINLILFSYLSLYLVIKDINTQVSKPIKLLLEEKPKEDVFSLIKPVSSLAKAPSQKTVNASGSAPLKAERGDIPISPKKDEEQNEESILSEIEKKVLSKKAGADQSNVKVGEQLGEITASIVQGHVGFAGGSRQVVFVPPFPKIAVTELPSTVQLKIWVDPSGKISKVEILKRSGVPEVDKSIVDFVKGIRFEPIRDNIIQTGIMTFRFKGG
jgi:TonB family C-terminal domain